VAGVRTDSEILEGLIEEYSVKGEVMLLGDESKGRVEPHQPYHCLFIPYDTPAFREVFYFIRQRMTAEETKRFYHGFLLYGSGLLNPPRLNHGQFHEEQGKGRRGMREEEKGRRRRSRWEEETRKGEQRSYGQGEELWGRWWSCFTTGCSSDCCCCCCYYYYYYYYTAIT